PPRPLRRPPQWRAGGRRPASGCAERAARPRRLSGRALMAAPSRRVRGYGLGTVDTVLSVDAVEKAAADLAATGPSVADLDALAGPNPLLAIDGLVAGYGGMGILPGPDPRLRARQSPWSTRPHRSGKCPQL